MPKTDRSPDPEEALTLDAFLCFAIYSAGHAFNRVYKPLLDELGVTYPQCHRRRQIDQKPPV